MIDEIIKILDKYIVTDDDGCQWLSIEFNELEEKIRDLDKADPI